MGPGGPLRVVAPAVEPVTRSALEGTWRSGLGSVMRLVGTGAGGLAGTYASAVGDEEGARPLVGFHGGPQADRSIVLGFVVRWPAAASIAAWTGRYDPDADVIRATWLLVTEADAADAWCATRVGADEFHRPDAEDAGEGEETATAGERAGRAGRA